MSNSFFRFYSLIVPSLVVFVSFKNSVFETFKIKTVWLKLFVLKLASVLQFRVISYTRFCYADLSICCWVLCQWVILICCWLRLLSVEEKWQQFPFSSFSFFSWIHFLSKFRNQKSSIELFRFISCICVALCGYKVHTDSISVSLKLHSRSLPLSQTHSGKLQFCIV